MTNAYLMYACSHCGYKGNKKDVIEHIEAHNILLEHNRNVERIVRNVLKDWTIPGKE